MNADGIHYSPTKKLTSTSQSDMCAHPAPCCSISACGQTTCCLSSHMPPPPPPPPTHNASLSIGGVFTPGVKALDPRPAGLTLCKDREPLGFLCYRRVPDYSQAKVMHTPLTAITSLTTPPVSAHSFSSSSKALPSCCHLNMRAQQKKRGHLAHALEAKKKKELNCSCHGNVLKQD